MRYILDFGSANAGSVPAFDVFKNADALTDVTAPSLVESGEGIFYFDYTWSSPSITSIMYKASVNGVELSDVINSDASASGAVTVGAGAGVNPWLWTAGQILNMVATEAGLPEASNPYASTNAYFVQLRTLLKSAGLEISQARDWKVLEKEAVITGDGVTTSFALPSDFLRLKDESGFDRTSNRSFGGPVSAPGWQGLRASGVTPSLRPLYRVQAGRMVFFEAPADASTLAYEYVSRFWVASDGAASADSYFPAAAGDVVMLEPLMVTRLVKAKFRQAKGFDTMSDFADYERALDAAASLEPAPVLNLGACSPRSERFIGTANLPDTGYGE
jgi:hypothetical protein